MKKIPYHTILCLLGICLLLYSMPVFAATNPTATGESGTNGSGGGGGVVGGVAGEAILHYHDNSCYGTRELSRTASNTHNSYRDNDDDLIHSYQTVAEGPKNNANYIVIDCAFQLNGGHNCGGSHAYLRAYDQNGNVFWTKSPDQLVEEGRNLWNNAIPGNEAARFIYNKQPYETHANVDWDSNGNPFIESTNYYWLHRDANGTIKRYAVINGSNNYVPDPPANMRGQVSSSEKSGTNFWNSTNYRIYTTIQIPSYVTYVKFELLVTKDNRLNHGTNANVYNATLGGFYGCGYNNGDIVRSKASFGGTSDVSTTDTINNTALNTTQSKQTGNGIFQMQVVNGNLLNGVDNISYLNNVSIRDLAYPDMIKKIEMKEASNQRIITWETPQSNGTEYELKAQTYKIDFTAKSGVELLMDTEFN